MTDYEKKNKMAEKLLASAPPLKDCELNELNALFTAYIFRRSKTREIWTTCCGKHEIIPKQEYSDALHEVLTAEHQAEERSYRTPCHMGYMPAPRKTREKTSCPFCGTEVYVKELGRTGGRKNLSEYKRAVVFRWYRGVLWARAYYLAKHYTADRILTSKPAHELCEIYRFRPGEAISMNVYWKSICTMTSRPASLPLPIYEPFVQDSVYGMGYDIIFPDEINKSPFRYCGFDAFTNRHYSAMRFLAICCIYPRQTEMLMKAGMMDAVNDLARGWKWNAAAFNWEETDPLKSFGLNKQEMKMFLESSRDLDILVQYKRLRKQKVKCTIPDIYLLYKRAPYMKAKQVITKLKEYKIEPAKWNAYIEQAAREAHGKRKGMPSASNVAQQWIDYIDAAKTLGYDLANPLILMPKQIVRKHNLATKTAAAILENRLAEEQSAKEKARNEELTEKYAFSTDRFIIRAPVSMVEITAEGKALKHCVGGYAQRHVDGKVAILFLRDVENPGKPLVTIEMNGDKLVQIHGYMNDQDKNISPNEEYRDILDPWLAWIKAGSKRNKKGDPILPRKYKLHQQAIAQAVAV